LKKAAFTYPNSDPMQKLIHLTNTPVMISKGLSFGKHKGKSVADIAKIDRGYLNWMLENMSLDIDMRYTISNALK